MKNYVKDPNLDALNYILSQHPDGFTYSTDGDSIRITPKQDYLGKAQLQINATDPDTTTLSNIFSILYVDDRNNITIITRTPDGTSQAKQQITIDDMVDTTTTQGATFKLKNGTYTAKTQDTNNPQQFNPTNFNIQIDRDTTYEQLITEIYNYLGNHNKNMNEGDTLSIAKNNFKYATSLKSLTIVNTDTWTKTKEDQDSIYIITTDPNLFGENIPLTLKATGQYQTQNTEQLLVDIRDMITITGKLGDNNTWKNPIFGGDNTIEGHYGIIVYDTDTTCTDEQGNYTIKVPANQSITLKARATLQDKTKRSFQATFRLGELSQNIQDKILHVVMFKYAEQAGLTPQQQKQFMYDVNFARNNSIDMNWEGLKTFDKDSLFTHITRDSWKPDSFSVDEQNYIETIERDSLFAKMQKKDWPIHKAQLGEEIPFNRAGTRLWTKQDGAPHFSITANDDKPGVFYRSNMTVSSGEPRYIAEIMEEGASGLFECNGLNSDRPSWEYMAYKTVQHMYDPPGHKLSISDITLLRIVENFDATTLIEDILGE